MLWELVRASRSEHLGSEFALVVSHCRASQTALSIYQRQIRITNLRIQCVLLVAEIKLRKVVIDANHYQPGQWGRVAKLYQHVFTVR